MTPSGFSTVVMFQVNAIRSRQKLVGAKSSAARLVSPRANASSKLVSHWSTRAAGSGSVVEGDSISSVMVQSSGSGVTDSTAAVRLVRKRCTSLQRGPDHTSFMSIVGFSAVAPGVDLGQHAAELRRVHDTVLSGGRPARRPRPIVARSWQRVLGAGVPPGGPQCREPFSRTEVERRRASSSLRFVVDGLFASLASVADASQFLIVITDADGVILWRRGSVSVRIRADSLGFAEGAVWTEARVGTNAIGTALAEETPVQLFSAEHFEQHQHPWYCTAAPLHDPATGDLLGIVDISGPALTLHPALTALVEMSVQLARTTLWERLQRHHDRIRQGAEPMLAGLSAPHLLVDDDGWVVQSTGVRSPHRVGAPDAAVAQLVPGVGLCLPEPVGEGWLMRGAGEDAGIVIAIEDGPSPVLRVRRDDVSWRVPLTARRAEVLRLLATAGAAGTTARRLSRTIFGSDDHEVTIRAEISRMRRSIGALVSTGPYRLAEGVRFEPEG